MTNWNIYLGKKLIDSVYYDNDCDSDYVKRSLINHDGYHPNIAVRKAKVVSNPLPKHQL